MLRRLRKVFTAITCSLLALVTLVILGTTFMTSYASMHRSEAIALDREIEGTSEEPPVIGGDAAGDDSMGRGHMLVARVFVNDSGIVTANNGQTVTVDLDDLNDIIDHAMGQNEASGSLPSSHLVWRSVAWSGGTKLVIIDTSAVDEMLDHQLASYVALFVFIMGGGLVASWELSAWALRPIEKSWEQQRRFVADASHELKTPLSVILANTQILRAADSGVPDEDRRWVESTAEEAGRMKLLVEDLLDLARSEESADGHGRRTQVEIDLSELVEGVALQYDAVAFEAGCLVDARIEPGVRVRGDASELERLAKILLDNACKYAPSNTDVVVSLAAVGGHARLAVTNLGDPIPPEDLPHVFERFYRSDRVRTKNDKGSYGLGLAIAQSIVEGHGGTIAVESDSANGTTFSVDLPAL